MKRLNQRGLLAAASLALVFAAAGGAVAWSASPGADRVTRPPGDAAGAGHFGIAGPFGPQAITAFPSYFKRVTFANNQLGQSQIISAQLPAGRYLVEVLTPGGGRPDCMGVSFPLVPPIEDGMDFRGYVTVTGAGGAASVSCYERATDATSTVTYELFYIPAMSVRSARSARSAS
jgi:hypothetical protein